MVNSVSTSNVINQTTEAAKKEDIQKLLKYVNNEALTEKPDTFTRAAKENLSSSSFFEGIPLFNLLRRNKKLNGSFISEEMKALGETNKKALNNIFKGEGKLTERIGNFIKTANESKRTYSDLKDIVKSKAKASKLGQKAAEKAAEAAANPNSSKLTKLADKAAQKAEKAASKAAAKSAEQAAIKGAEQAAATGAKAAGKFGKLGKFMKSSGATFMLAFSGITELATEVVPTFKELGNEKGMKQLGKSAVKVLGDTAGFVAGQQIGTAAGTAIGTAICPGIGTAIGAVVGFAGGMLGSWVSGKVTKAITGPSEREIAKEEQEQKNIEEIAGDENQTEQLKNEVLAKIQEEAALNNGELTEDGIIAMEALENLEESNPFAA
ncbi:MAG: hypothetical protein LUH05_07190 [Candidatus Gastranaerophilales bacterium]|nr:hypothetical protein [Candidatus Gastranaerophilales bacterium]